IRNNKQKLQVSLQKNSFVARRLFNKTLFGETRYGYVPDMTAYDALTSERLSSLFRQQYKPSNCTLVIAGKITSDTITQLDRLFGRDWGEPVDSLLEKPMPEVMLPEQRLAVAVREETVQSAIRIGGLTIQRSHPDF